MSRAFPADDGGDLWAAAYEQVRLQACGGQTARGDHGGLVFVLREGVAAWMARRAASGAEAAKSAAAFHQAGKAPVVTEGFHTGLVRVLAGMAMAQSNRREMIR